MPKLSPRFRFICACVALLALAFGAGCGNDSKLIAVSETDEKQFQYGRDMLREGRTDDALTAFLSVIRKREDDAPESHLEAGQILLNAKNDPIAAIYHFHAYLEAKPKSEQAPMVAQLIDTAKKNFAATLAGHPGIYDQTDQVDQISALKNENEDLRRQLAAAQMPHGAGISLGSLPPSPTVTHTSAVDTSPNLSQPVTATTVRAVTAVDSPTPATTSNTTAPATTSSRTYTVAGGDSLSKISLKIFGNENRAKDIFNINRDQLPSIDTRLKIGLVLKIPAQ